MIDGTSVLTIVIICLIIVLLFIYFRLGRMITLLGEKKQELELGAGYYAAVCNRCGKLFTDDTWKDHPCCKEK